MIDSTKSPTPTWQRYMVAALLTVLIAVLGYMLYTKELHHSPSTASSPPAPAATTVAPRRAVPTPATTIPGGIPVSSRDPFAG